MGNLTWLRSRIWFALALPAVGACGGKDDKTPQKPVAHDAGVGNEVPDDPDKPNGLGSWELTDSGCGGSSWCAMRGDEVACPAEATFTDEDQGPGAGTYAVEDAGGACCIYIQNGEPCLGRAYLDGDRAVVACADARGDQWAAAALIEHASIASFARATLELMAVGAPPALIAGCQHAALDEIAHAQGCLAIAAKHGHPVEPGPIEALAPRGGGLAAVARDTFLEGCVGETLGAIQAADARDAADDPEARALMARIADDEARHAELAWQTVAWAVSKDPQIKETLRAVAERARTDAPVWREVIDPTLARILA